LCPQSIGNTIFGGKKLSEKDPEKPIDKGHAEVLY
jgi:hypothetical protein